jgi:hypothetical protein
VEAAAVSPTSIRVYWQAVPGATAYRIYRDGQRVAETPGEPVSLPSAAQLGIQLDKQRSYVDTIPSAGGTHIYSVGAVRSIDESPKSKGYLERAFEEPFAENRCDVLVVGGNAGGVSAAVAAARYGLKVILLDESKRLGGMCVNGLGASDIRRIDHASGFFEEFRRKVVSLYGGTDGLKYEPRVSQQAIKEIVWSTPGLTVHRQWRATGVKAKDGLISEVAAESMTDGRKARFLPKIVIDATECGDVAAWAGGTYRVGREARSKREPHAGNIYYSRKEDKILPPSTGKADKHVQAYAYLMIVKDYGPGADRTIPQPPGYDPKKYDHAPKFDVSWAKTSGKLPNDKYEINQHPHGSDLQGVNWGYANADLKERRRIEQLFKEHALGYLYYIQTVEGKKNIGLSEDDYRDTDGWPTLLYIRESRRFDAGHYMDETDIMEARKIARPNAIGIGDYAMDSHATQPKTDWSMEDMGEGEYYLPQYTPWHQVPHNIMIPKGLRNLYCPTAISATHVAYGTYRMEPVRMLFGASAGIGAYICLKYGVEPKDVPVRQIQAEMLKRHVATPEMPARDGVGNTGPLGAQAILYSFPDVPFDHPRYQAIMWLAARGFYPCPVPEKRTPSSGLVAAPFRPDEVITAGEAHGLATALDLRRTLLDADPKLAPVMVGTIADRMKPLSRASGASLLSSLMGLSKPVQGGHYADISDDSIAQAAESLYMQWIDSRLWDPLDRSPDGKLYFRPEKLLTRAEWSEMLYLASIHLGPLWMDHPLDKAPVDVSVVSALK